MGVCTLEILEVSGVLTTFPGPDDFKALLLCTLQGPLFVSGTFLHLRLLPLLSTYLTPQIGFVDSETWEAWPDIKSLLRNFLKDKSEIYFDDDERRKLFSELLERCLTAIDTYYDKEDEKSLRDNVLPSDIV